MDKNQQILPYHLRQRKKFLTPGEQHFEVGWVQIFPLQLFQNCNVSVVRIFVFVKIDWSCAQVIFTSQGLNQDPTIWLDAAMTYQSLALVLYFYKFLSLTNIYKKLPQPTSPKLKCQPIGLNLYYKLSCF
jgi:hypothetical protein